MGLLYHYLKCDQHLFINYFRLLIYSQINSNHNHMRSVRSKLDILQGLVLLYVGVYEIEITYLQVICIHCVCICVYIYTQIILSNYD